MTNLPTPVEESSLLPPHDVIAEAGALGSVLSSNGNAAELFSRLNLDLFYDERHRGVFRALDCVRIDGKPLDPVGLFQWLRDKGRLEAAGGFDYVAALPNQCPSPENFPSYLETLQDRATRRAVLNDAVELEQLARNLALPVGAIHDSAKRMAEAYSITGDEQQGRKIGELVAAITGDDPNEILKNRFLGLGGGALMVGPTGVGKSSFVIQCCARWTNGLPCFDIVPARKLKIVLIQAENDDGDMADMRDGIATGLNLTPSQRKTFFDNVIVFEECNRVGQRLCDEVIAPAIRKHKPDLVVIDPALSYIGGNTISQEDVGRFLRNQLNPVIKAGKCAVIMVHHTNKPASGEQKASWSNGDFAYLGSGSAEWANWARAVLAIQTTATRGVFKLHAAKRGARLGWRDESGALTFEKLIAHSREPDRICWRDASEAEIPSKGRPKTNDPAKIISLLPPSGLENSQWQKLADKKRDIPKTSFRRMRDEAEASGLVIESATGLWMPIIQKGQKGQK